MKHGCGSSRKQQNGEKKHHSKKGFIFPILAHMKSQSYLHHLRVQIQTQCKSLQIQYFLIATMFILGKNLNLYTLHKLYFIFTELSTSKMTNPQPQTREFHHKKLYALSVHFKSEYSSCSRVISTYKDSACHFGFLDLLVIKQQQLLPTYFPLCSFGQSLFSRAP